jgi:hypothetical protein
LGSSDSCCASPANGSRWPQPQMPLDLSASASALPHLHDRSIFSSSGSVTASAAFPSTVLMQPLLLWADGGRGARVGRSEAWKNCSFAMLTEQFTVRARKPPPQLAWLGSRSPAVQALAHHSGNSTTQQHCRSPSSRLDALILSQLGPKGTSASASSPRTALQQRHEGCRAARLPCYASTRWNNVCPGRQMQ